MRPSTTIAVFAILTSLGCGQKASSSDPSPPQVPSSVGAPKGSQVDPAPPSAGTGGSSATDPTLGSTAGGPGSTGGSEDPGADGAPATLDPDAGMAVDAATTMPGGGSACEADFLANGSSPECATCACTTCGMQATQFLASNRSLSDPVSKCALEKCCAGTQCYCANDIFGCMLAPAGPCVAEIEAAAGAKGVLGINAPCNDPNNPCGAAYLLGLCLTGEPLANPPRVGMCPACSQCGG